MSAQGLGKTRVATLARKYALAFDWGSARGGWVYTLHTVGHTRWYLRFRGRTDGSRVSVLRGPYRCPDTALCRQPR